MPFVNAVKNVFGFLGSGGYFFFISSTIFRWARKPLIMFPCFCSISSRFGKVAASDIWPGSEPCTPPTRGSASRSRISRPIRRRMKLSRVSSLRSPAGTRFLGMKRSMPARILPGQENSPVVANGRNFVGANIITPSGIG